MGELHSTLCFPGWGVVFFSWGSLLLDVIGAIIGSPGEDNSPLLSVLNRHSLED